MSKIKKRNGFTLIELLATIAVLSVILTIVIYSVINVVGNSKKKSYQVTINNIESVSSSYLLENVSSKVWIDSDYGDYQYQCVTVQNLIEAGYFKSDVLESMVDDNTYLKADDSIYIERDVSSKNITKNILLVGNASSYSGLCNNVSLVGDISFIVSPSGWSNEKDISIKYKLYNYDNISNYKYNYSYILEDGSEDKTLSEVFKNSLVTKNFSVDKNGILYAKILDSSGNDVVNRTLIVNKIDSDDSSASISSTNNAASTQTVTLSMSDASSGIKSYYFGSINPNEDNVDWVDVSNGENGVSSYVDTHEVDTSGVWYLGVIDVVGNMTVVSKEFYLTTLSISNASISSDTILTMEGNELVFPTINVDNGYEFNGWYSSSNYSGEVITKYVPSDNAILYGKNVSKSYIVTLDSNGATTEGTTSVSVSYGNAMPTITNPSRSGYVIDGFYSIKTAIDLEYTISDLNTTSRRINLLNDSNEWEKTSEDVGTHIQMLMTIQDESLTTAPKLEFNDVSLTQGSDYYIVGVVGNWTYYIDFDISSTMVSKRTYNYDTDYRFIDINNISSDGVVSIINATKDGKKYYNNAGKSAWNYDLYEDTKLYAKWSDIEIPIVSDVVYTSNLFPTKSVSSSNVMTVSNTTLTTTGTDPYIVFSNLELTDITKVIVTLDTAVSSSFTFQVFYATSGASFSEANSVKVSVSSGAKVIEATLPGGTYTAIRFDFGSKSGVTFNVSGIDLVGKNISNVNYVHANIADAGSLVSSYAVTTSSSTPSSFTDVTDASTYHVRYSASTNATATYYVWGMDGDGNVSTSSNISASKTLLDKMVALDTTSYIYDGTAKTPTIVVKDGVTTLTKDTHYTVSYSNNTDVGTATATITGKGLYSGTISKTFTISSNTLNGSVKISGTNTYNEILTANVTNTNGASLSYQWWYASSASATSGTNINGATSSTYTVGSGLVGKYIGVSVIATKTNYDSAIWTDITDSTNNTTATVARATGVCSVKITGTNLLQEILTASITTNSDGTKGYSWYYNSSNSVSGGTALNVTSQTYTISDDLYGKYIYVSASVAQSTNYTAATCTDITDESNNTTATVGDTIAPDAPVITRIDYNTFTCSSEDIGSGVVGYYISMSSTKPSTSSTWLGVSTCTSGYDISEEGTYYVWAKDAAGNISDSSSISAYTITRSQGTGTTLTTKYDYSGREFASNSIVLSGTPIYVSATPNTGYLSASVTVSGTLIVNPSVTIVTSDVTIVSSGTPNTYKISYVLNGGTLGTNAPTSGMYDSVVEISNPTKSGYTFTGWTFSSNGTTSTAMYGTSSSVVTTAWSSSTKVTETYFKNLTSTNGATVKLTANWEKTVTGTFYYYDGSAVTSTSSTCTMYDSDTACIVSVPSVVLSSDGPVNTTYVGVSSSINSMEVVNDFSISSNATYYAVYTTKNVSIYYSNSSAVNQIMNLYRNSFLTSTSTIGVVLSTSSDGISNYDVTDGYGGAGWKGLSTSSTSTEVTYSTIGKAAASTYTTLYTVYEMSVTYSKGINVSAIGSTNDTCRQLASSKSCAVTLPSITANTGYTSVGWSATNGATSGTAASASYTLSTNDMTLYANAIDITAPTGIFNVSDGTTVATSDATFTDSSVATGDTVFTGTSIIVSFIDVVEEGSGVYDYAFGIGNSISNCGANLTQNNGDDNYTFMSLNSGSYYVCGQISDVANNWSDIYYLNINLTSSSGTIPLFTYDGDDYCSSGLCTIVDDNDDEVDDPETWEGNWKIRFTESAELIFKNLNGIEDDGIDIFVVGGGGAGGHGDDYYGTWSSGGGGGGGGSSVTTLGFAPEVATVYNLTIGSGGTSNYYNYNVTNGEESTFSVEDTVCYSAPGGISGLRPDNSTSDYFYNYGGTGASLGTYVSTGVCTADSFSTSAGSDGGGEWFSELEDLALGVGIGYDGIVEFSGSSVTGNKYYGAGGGTGGRGVSVGLGGSGIVGASGGADGGGAGGQGAGFISTSIECPYGEHYSTSFGYHACWGSVGSNGGANTGSGAGGGGGAVGTGGESYGGNTIGGTGGTGIIVIRNARVTKKVTISYNVNGGDVTSSTTDETNTYTWTTDSSGNIYRSVNDASSSLFTYIMDYDDVLSSYGLADWDNSSALDISRTGYSAVSGAEWICLSGDCTIGTTYSDSSVYEASDFCDASSSDCTVVLGVNWVELQEDTIVLASYLSPSSVHTYYRNGNTFSTCCAYVGYVSANGDNYVVRYAFTTSSEQKANKVKIVINPAWFHEGDNSRLRFYIGTSSSSHINASGSSLYNGILVRSSVSLYTGYSDLGYITDELTGISEIDIEPNTTYYLWMFSDGEANGYYRYDVGVFDAWVKIILNPSDD